MKKDLLAPATVSKKNSSGFTLVEVMVVVIILGILSGLSTAGFWERLNKTKVQTAMHLTQEILSQASIEVKKTNSSKSVSIGDTVITLWEGLDCSGTKISSETIANGTSFAAPVTGATYKVSTGLPEEFGAPSAKVGGEWSSCIKFPRNQTNNNVEGTGYVLIVKEGTPKSAAIVLKTARDNRFQSYFFSGEWKKK